ncbi:MAG: hypothetical protein HY800_09550, partial [Ignavibacteriales bacterium]|nr:hypothetical protein [Ignavibacteriales bacterium]
MIDEFGSDVFFVTFLEDMKFQIQHRLLFLLMLLIAACESPNIIVYEAPHRYPQPSRNQIPDQTVFINNTLGPICFTMGDRNFNVEQLHVSAISSNKKLVDS